MPEGNPYYAMTAEQAEWLAFCSCAYKSHMHNLGRDDTQGVSLLHGPARIECPDLVCVAIRSASSPNGSACMAFFDAAGRVVAFVDCVHDAVFAWPTLQDELSERSGLGVLLN